MNSAVSAHLLGSFGRKTEMTAGTGTFATVKAAVEIGSGERVAIKVIDKSKHWSDERTREQLMREINILRNIRHPNITAIKDVVESELYLFLVLELYVMRRNSGVSLLSPPSSLSSLLSGVRVMGACACVRACVLWTTAH